VSERARQGWGGGVVCVWERERESEVEKKQPREKQELNNETKAPPKAFQLRGQGLAGRIARTLSSMQQVIAGKRATAECDGGTQREAVSTEKQQLKEPLEQPMSSTWMQSKTAKARSATQMGQSKVAHGARKGGKRANVR